MVSLETDRSFIVCFKTAKQLLKNQNHKSFRHVTGALVQMGERSVR